MASYATKAAEAFAAKVLEIFYESSVADKITNSDYEGEIKNRASKVNIGTLGKLGLRDYTGADVTWDDLTESVAQLATDQAKYYAFKVDSLDEFISFIKNPEGTVLSQASNELKEVVDGYILGLHGDVGAGNRSGTSYTTGTVEVANTTGVVTGSGTTFTAAMVGKPFKAAGHTKWYRVKARNSNTEIVIEDDKDDEASAYTGGAISAGATYEIQAVTAVQITKDNIVSKVLGLKTFLDKAKVPLMNRWLAAPSDITNIMPLATEGPSTVSQEVYDEMVKRGYVGMLGGFRVYSTEMVAGDAVNGYHVMAGIPGAITMALGFTQSDVFPKLENTFGRGYKGLTVYGAKVPDERRKALAEGFWKL